MNRGRKTAMLIAALLVLPTILAPHTGTLWLAVAIISLAAAAHQWWSANLFTLVSDMYPRRAVGSVVGIGGFAGAIAAMLFQRSTGYILQASERDYAVIFTVCGLMYVTALLVIHLLVPRLEEAKLPAAAEAP